MTAKEINKKIQEMISNDSVPQDEIIRFVKGECQTVSLTPQTLGMLFEMYADLTPPTIEIVGFLGGAARFITKPCLKQRVMRFPTVRYGCSV